MAKINFVGFQEHVEIPDGHKLVVIENELRSALGREALFSLLSEPEKISQWFYSINQLESKQGGKVKFVGDSGVESEGVCTAYVSGKEIAILSSDFGNFSAKVNGRKECSIRIKFTLLTNNPESAKVKIEGFVSKLRGLVTV